jgi:DNA-binding NarL/FixJ family response regulator
VRGYVSKASPVDALAPAIRTVAAGGTYLDPHLSEGLIAASVPSLTPREQEVLHLVARGLSNAEIATSIGVSTKNVEFHLSHVMEKLEGRSRGEAVFHAEALGLVDHDLHISFSVKHFVTGLFR